MSRSQEKVSPAATMRRMNCQIAGQSSGAAALIDIPGFTSRLRVVPEAGSLPIRLRDPGGGRSSILRPGAHEGVDAVEDALEAEDELVVGFVVLVEDPGRECCVQ